MDSSDTLQRIARPAKKRSGKSGRPFGRGGKKKVGRGERKATGRKTGARKAGGKKPARRAKKKR